MRETPLSEFDWFKKLSHVNALGPRARLLFVHEWFNLFLGIGLRLGFLAKKRSAEFIDASYVVFVTITRPMCIHRGKQSALRIFQNRYSSEGSMRAAFAEAATNRQHAQVH